MKYKTYSNLFRIGWGLRFSKKLKKNEGVILKLPFQTKVRVSMWFVFFPLTVLFVNKKNIITHVQNLKPFQVSERKEALYIVEMNLNDKYRKGQKFEMNKKTILRSLRGSLKGKAKPFTRKEREGFWKQND